MHLQNRINRNILECKGIHWHRCYSRRSSINRNILECKVLMVVMCLRTNTVLIETYWNVKRWNEEVIGIKKQY